MSRNKVAILCYHKNIKTIYPAQWIDEFQASIETQTFKNFDIFEMDYGGGVDFIFKNKFAYRVSRDYPTFVHALSHLLSKAFEMDYDYVLNTNADDYYAPDWVEKTIIEIQKGYDLVSCNFALVQDGAEVLRHNFHNLDIKTEVLYRENNIIAHPAVCYSRKFWENNSYDPDEIPIEDMRLWQRAINKGMKIKIVENCLLFHRLHDNSVCRNNSNR